MLSGIGSAISSIAGGGSVSGGISGVGQAMAGGAMGMIGSLYQDYRNRKAVDRQNDWTANMSNTAYQRAVADMRKAGLNPMLAYSQGGASTPQGGAIGVDSPDIQGGISSAIAMKRLNVELEKIKSDTDLNRESAKVAQAQAELTKNNAKSVLLGQPKLEAESKLMQMLIPGLSTVNTGLKQFMNQKEVKINGKD